MSKIDTIENISNTLAASSIAVMPKRCVFIRNWHSKCKSCLSACQHEAVRRSLGRLSIDSDACTDCGACATACPVSAMLTTAPNASDIVRQARVSAERNGGSAAFICARNAERINVDAERVVVLPCLDYLDEYLIAGMFALDFKRVVLFDCGCEGCDVDCEQPYFEETIRSAEHLLELWKVPGMLKVLDEVPETLILDKPRAKGAAIKTDRREAFKQTGASALGYAWRSVASALGSLAGDAPEDENRQIVVSPDERYDPASYRSVRLLNMLDRIGERPYGATVESRFWASVDIDPNACKHCGACARMCPTQALRYAVDDESRATLVFQPSLCVNCRLCKDSCISHTLVYANKVPAAELNRDFVKTLYENEELPKQGAPRISKP